LLQWLRYHGKAPFNLKALAIFGLALKNKMSALLSIPACSPDSSKDVAGMAEALVLSWKQKLTLEIMFPVWQSWKRKRNMHAL